jgi:eukaryotic-like serine/threonine-protein kinase
MSEPSLLPRLLEPDTVIDGRYRIESLLEQGSMGAVYAARHIQLDEPVALKFLSQPKAEQAGFRARFLREAQVTAKLRGRNIVRTSDFGVDDADRPFLVMELLEGDSLREKLAHTGRLPIPLAVDYAVQICQGLAEAHRRGVVHRDLKPANLFIIQDVDGSELVKILDFGLSKLRFLVDEDITAEGTSMGSPKYMAPELIGSAETADEKADIWSLGAILYEMLAGAPPFRAPSTARLIMQVASGKGIVPLTQERPEVSPALNDAILRCLTKDLAQRTESVGSLAAQLSAAVPEAGLEQAAQQVVDILFKSERRVRQSPARLGEGSTGDAAGNRLRSEVNENRSDTSNGASNPGAAVLTWVASLIALGVIAALAWFAFGPTSSSSVGDGHDAPIESPQPSEVSTSTSSAPTATASASADVQPGPTHGRGPSSSASAHPGDQLTGRPPSVRSSHPAGSDPFESRY